MGGKGCRQPFGDKWGNWNVHGVSDNTKLVFIFVGTRVVSVGCYITHHRLGVLKQQFISHRSGGRGGLTSRCQIHSPVRTCFLMHRRRSSRCVVMWGRGEGAPWGLIRIFIPLSEAPPSRPTCLPTLNRLLPSRWTLGFSTWI